VSGSDEVHAGKGRRHRWVIERAGDNSSLRWRPRARFRSPRRLKPPLYEFLRYEFLLYEFLRCQADRGPRKRRPALRAASTSISTSCHRASTQR